MKFLLASLVLLSSFNLLFSQEDKVYDKVYFKNASFENDKVKIEIDNVVSLPKETKFRMTITNKTADFIIYNSEESNFDIPGQDVRAKEKSWMIAPFDSKKKVMRAFGEGLNSIREFDFNCEGFYVIKIQDAEEVEDFRLPVAKNNFTAGDFKASLKNLKKKTQGTDVKFDVTYTGQHLGFIFPDKASVLMPDGNIYASSNAGADPIILKPGETDNFSATWDRMPGGRKNDMQLVAMIVKFDGVFAEAIPKKFDGKTIKFIWDDALTDGKN